MSDKRVPTDALSSAMSDTEERQPNREKRVSLATSDERAPPVKTGEREAPPSSRCPMEERQTKRERLLCKLSDVRNASERSSLSSAMSDGRAPDKTGEERCSKLSDVRRKSARRTRERGCSKLSDVQQKSARREGGCSLSSASQRGPMKERSPSKLSDVR